MARTKREAEVADVVVAESATIRVRRRPRADAGRVLLAVRVPKKLAHRLRVFVTEKDLLIQDLVESALRAILAA